MRCDSVVGMVRTVVDMVENQNIERERDWAAHINKVHLLISAHVLIFPFLSSDIIVGTPSYELNLTFDPRYVGQNRVGFIAGECGGGWNYEDTVT